MAGPTNSYNVIAYVSKAGRLGSILGQVILKT